MANPTPLLDTLLDDIANARVVPFVGMAGSANTPGAGQLAARLAAALGSASPVSGLCEIAQEFEQVRQRHALITEMSDWLRQTAPQPAPIHHWLARLPFTRYFTTAPHDLLEQALTQAGKPPTVVVSEEETSYFESKPVTVVKLLGDASRPASLVLTEGDQLTFLDRLPLLTTVVRGALAVKTLFFVDYDLNDAEMRRLILQAVFNKIERGQGKHKLPAYALWPQAPDETRRQFWADRHNLSFIAAEPVAFLQTLHQELSKRQPTPSPSTRIEAPPFLQDPFRLLDAYGPDDAGLFFGRDKEIAQLGPLILAHRLVVVTGASGTGKTSLLRAGVQPRLENESWKVAYARLLDEPVASIRSSLLALAPNLSRADNLHDLISGIEAALPDRLVLIIDQFEEAFRRLGPQALQTFAGQWAACLNDPQLDTHFVIILRDDYYLQLNTFTPQLPEIFHNVFILNRLQRDQALQAALQPLKQAKVEVEEGLVERIVQDLDDNGVDPPQLQVVGYRLYYDMLGRGARRLTIADYERLGGIKELLPAYLSEKLVQIPDARPVLEALVGEGGLKALRSQAEIAERVAAAPEAVQVILEKLIEARLVRTVMVPSGDAHYELAHDLLAATIWSWLAEGAQQAEAARGVIERGLSDWQTSQTLLDAPRLDFVALRWPFLSALAADAQALLLRSALTLGHDTARWQDRISDLTLRRQLVLELAGHADPGVRTRMMTAFAQLPGVSAADEPIMAVIRQAVIADADAGTRHSAAFSLAQIQKDAGIRFLAEQAQATADGIGSRAIEALATLGDAHIRIWPHVAGKVRRQTAVAIARLRLDRHRQQWRGRVTGAAAGGALGFWFAFSLSAFLIEHSKLAPAIFNGMFASFFGALAGAITGLGVALAAALADGDHRIARAAGGALGGAVGLALGLEVYWLVHLTDRFMTFAWVGLLAGVCIGVGLGLAPTSARWPWAQPAAGVAAGVLGFLAAYPLLVAYADFIASLLVRTIFDLTLWKVLLMGAAIGGMIGAGLVWADRRLVKLSS